MHILTASFTEQGLLSTHLESNTIGFQNQIIMQLDQTEAQRRPDLVHPIITRAQQEWDAIRYGKAITAPRPTSPWQRLSMDHH